MLKITTVLLAVFLFSGVLIAQTYSSIEERIVSLQTQIQVNNDGTLSVIEDIYYDFGPNQRHGIYRDIPFVKTNGEGKKFKLDIKEVEVAGDKSTLSSQAKNLRIKIGDPDKTVSGKKRYQISYKIYGALTYFSDHDELYWNLTGNSWQVPIDQFESEIIFPFDVKYTDLTYACYSGISGSTASNCSIFAKNLEGYSFVKITADKRLVAGEGVTSVIGFPKNLVAVLEPKAYFDPIWIIMFVISMFVLVSLYIHAVIIKRWWSDRQNTLSKQKIVTAWFQPPNFKRGQEFTPAETTGLVNKKVDHKTLSASIIYLAQKGFLKIVVDDKKTVTFLKKKDWSNDADLRDHDKMLLDAIFQSESTVTDKKLKKSFIFAERVIKVQKAVMKHLLDEGMFKDNPVKYQETITAALMFASFFMLLIAPIGIPLTIFTWFIKTKSTRKTDLGIEKYSEAKSLLNFLVSQTEQLDFQAHNQMFFEKLLPYATAFGVEKIWAKRFASIEFAKNDWYEGPNNNAMLYIAGLNHLNSSFRAMTATNSSSGFSSGFSGGSSGGGGGGGGGGSW